MSTDRISRRGTGTASMTRSLVRVLALAALGRVAPVSATLFDSPTPDNFVRRAVARAAVLGNYVYVDGGELCQLEDGRINVFDTNPVNSTLSIDLSTSWTTTDVHIRTISKPGPNKINPTVWADTERGVFYSWGGNWLRGLNMSATKLWKFAADGSGGGNWSPSDPANPSAFSMLDPGEWSANTYTGTQGLAVGGIASGWTQQFRGRNQVLGGMLTYNFKSGIWENGTVGFSPYPTLLSASAQFVPNYGPNGLVFVFGGYSPPVGGEPDLTISTFHDLETITFFDPVTKKKYTQRTTGDVPPSPRDRFCVSGLQSTEGGYEIFLFGGQNQRAKTMHHDAFVLSLPAFVWTKLPEPPAGPRCEQSCVVVGKRQILSIGGADRQTRGAGMRQKDKAPNGLLLFDMSTLEWKDSYDANAAAYQRADVIKALYSKGSGDNVEWADADVQKMFATENKADPSSGSAGLGDNNGGSGNGATTAAGSSGSSGSNTGAIAGGVVGGVVALAVIGALVWFLRRKKQRNANAQPMSQPDVGTTGYAGHPQLHSGFPQDHAGGLQPHAATPQGYSHPQDVKYQYPAHPHVHEAGGDEYRQELHSDSVAVVPPVELYGGEMPGAKRN